MLSKVCLTCSNSGGTYRQSMLYIFPQSLDSWNDFEGVVMYAGHLFAAFPSVSDPIHYTVKKKKKKEK